MTAHESVQGKAPGSSDQTPGRPTRPAATPPPSGGQLLVSTAMIPPPATEIPAPPPPPGGTVCEEAHLPELDEDSVRSDYFTSGRGHGVFRVTHIPTGMTGEASAGRSQAEKRNTAMLLLRARLLVADLERESTT
jgi:hypothetical protein